MKPTAALLLLLAVPASAQMVGRFNLTARRIAEPISPISVPVRRTATMPQPSATIYVATPQGVTAYESIAGTLVQAGAYAVTGNMAGATASDLITISSTVDGDTVYDYALAADGSIASEKATVLSQSFQGSQCGPVVSASVDPRGFVYVQLAGEVDDEGETVCDAIQTYKADGLTFEGATTYDPGRFSEAGTQPVTSASFAYNLTPQGEACEDAFDTFSIEKSGTLDAIGGQSEPSPTPNPLGGWFYPLLLTADSANHLAVAMVQDFDPPCGTMGAIQLASFTVGQDGSITSTNTWQTMPAAGSDVEAMAIDPTNAWLAVAGDGLLIYRFSGGAAITPDGNNLLPGAAVNALGWDSAGYLYAWGVDAAGVFNVWTFTAANGAVTLAATVAVPGSTNMVVVPR